MKEAHPVSQFSGLDRRILLGFLLLVFLGFTKAPAQEDGHVFITEFLADDKAGTLRDQNGDKSDWIELRNLGLREVDLGGWHLTDDPTNLTKWTFPSTILGPSQFLVVFASGKDRATSGQQLHTSFSLSKEPEFLALVRPDGTNIAHAYSPTYPAQVADISYGVSPVIETNVLVPEGSLLRWRVPDPGELPSDWTAAEFDDSGWSEGTNGLGYSDNLAAYYATDLGAAMSNHTASVLARLPFLLSEEDLPDPDLFVLRIRYDDGFVAYLNGVEIARSSAPETLSWDSAATEPRPDESVPGFVEIDLGTNASLLQVGTNVLAVHGLNVDRDDVDFLVEPVLESRKIRLGDARYFLTPSPGKTNSDSYAGLVADTKFSMDRGFYAVPFTVAITTATAGAEIRYTTDGTAPDTVNGWVYDGPIPIGQTTVLRALATKPGFRPSNVDTHTYVFVSDVLTQSLQTAVARGFSSSWGRGADYAMDPRVVATNIPAVEAALKHLPSVFVSTSVSNLFDTGTGIYRNATRTGQAWERPVSIEMVGTNGQTEFQENCGLRIQGGAFRDFFFTEKKSFRVRFKKAYGVGTLKHRLFDEEDAKEEFDGFVLRAGANDGYSWVDAGTTVQFIRDEFGRSLHRAMGHPSPHGRFVHLYLNGLYWGLYNLVERPNEDFSASYFGGDPAQWDANNAGEYKSGGTQASSRWSSFLSGASAATSFDAYQNLQGLDHDGTRNPARTRYLDAPNYIDYMLVNMWGGNWDWPFKNYWFGYSTTNRGTGYKFYMWDFENTMGNNRARSPLNMVAPQKAWENMGVGSPHYRLKAQGPYRNDFADRAHRWFFNGGVLTPESLASRYQTLADGIEPAIIAESARWGDDNKSTPLGLAEWRAERDWILTNYLPQRSAIVLQQLKTANLYPTVAAPEFAQFGGMVADGFPLAMAQPDSSGEIFFTLDGSDPRTPGTEDNSPGAGVYSAPVSLLPPVLVRARAFQNGQWSALTEAFFGRTPDLGNLVISEIHYHPPDVGATDGDEFEFLELYNRGSFSLDLSDVSFTNGVAYTFPAGTILASGRFFVLARNATAFASKFPGVIIAGLYTGKLDNAGETLALVDATGTHAVVLAYDDVAPWPTDADGFGGSLQLRSPELPVSDPTSWVASRPSPGRAYDPEDTDGDGLPDAWELANGLSLDTNDTDGDPDGDGLTNLQELLAGTHPNDPASVLRLVPMISDGPSFGLSFSAASNHTFTVLERPSLDSPEWLKRVDVPAEPTNRTVQVTNIVLDTGLRLFRVVTPAQP